MKDSKPRLPLPSPPSRRRQGSGGSSSGLPLLLDPAEPSSTAPLRLFGPAEISSTAPQRLFGPAETSSNAQQRLSGPAGTSSTAQQMLFGHAEASNTAQQRLFDCQQKCRGLFGQLWALDDRILSLKHGMEARSQEGLESARALKQCIGEINELKDALEDRNSNYEMIVYLTYDIEIREKEKEMLQTKSQKADEELNECYQKNKDILRQLTEASKGKGSGSEQPTSSDYKGKKF